MFKIMQKNERCAEKGSALVYILIAIALLAALTVSFMEPSSQQTSSQSGFRALTAVKSQADTIRSAIQECILVYPNGDQTITSSTDPGYNDPFPVNPDSTHLASGYQASDKKVANIRCPGENDGAVDEHKKIFSGKKFMPPPPSLFEDWQYFNGSDGVFFWTQTNKSDAFLQTSLEKIDAQYGTCEADIIDASSSAVDLDDSSTVTCPSGYTCFRVWMIVNTTSSHADAADGCGT